MITLYVIWFLLQSYTLHDLSAYTEYNITVYVYNGYSIGRYGQNITVRTAEAGE